MGRKAPNTFAKEIKDTFKYLRQTDTTVDEVRLLFVAWLELRKAEMTNTNLT